MIINYFEKKKVFYLFCWIGFFLVFCGFIGFKNGFINLFFIFVKIFFRRFCFFYDSLFYVCLSFLVNFMF